MCEVPKGAIVGGGWYGCQIACILLSRAFDVELFERADRLFDGASGKNQFRLRAGFHYPRSSVTRTQISDGLREFRERVPMFVQPLHRCLYAVSASEGCVDTREEMMFFVDTPIRYYHVNIGLPIAHSPSFLAGVARQGRQSRKAQEGESDQVA